MVTAPTSEHTATTRWVPARRIGGQIDTAMPPDPMPSRLSPMTRYVK
jgi:hypothetical protein